jgi:hypothetical protein
MRTISSSDTLNSTPTHQQFSELVHQTLETVESKASKTDYRHTYSKWLTWCNANHFNPTDLRPGYVLIFLNEQEISTATRRHQLAALRKLAQMDYSLNPSDDTHYTFKALQTIKVSPLPHFR